MAETGAGMAEGCATIRRNSWNPSRWTSFPVRYSFSRLRETSLNCRQAATPLDFAFKIHSDVGCKCVGAKVNGKMVTIDHRLENGNIIEIVTSPNAAGPSIDWLKIAKSSSARNKIRQWLKKENKSDVVDQGQGDIRQVYTQEGL